MTIYKGDSSAAFGRNFITIHLNNPYEFEVSKVEFRCGCIFREIENPEFPLRINFDEEETKKFNFNNVCYLKAYDSLGRPKTCEGKLTFKAKEQVV